MREIKFRAWHIGEAKMHTDIAVLACPNELFRVYDSYAQEEYIGNDKHCEIMQYTGLKDKNGVEIYEGDIVRLKFRDNDPDTYTFESGVIRWHEDSAAFKWFSLTEDPSDGHNYWLTHADVNWRDVIGNIYENTELLEAKQ